MDFRASRVRIADSGCEAPGQALIPILSFIKL